MKTRHLSLLLCSTFLFTSSIVSGEAFTAETREHFALTTLVSVQYQPLKYVESHDPVDTPNQINLQNERDSIKEAWRKKNAELEPYSPEYYRHQAALLDLQAQWFPEKNQYYTQEKLDCLALAKKAEQAIFQKLQQKAWDIEEATYAAHTPEWFEFKAKVEGAKAEWCDKGSENYTILKANHDTYKTAAERARQKNAWDIEEATYPVDTPEWFEFKATVEGAKAEWCDKGSENYTILKANQQHYLQLADIMIRGKREEEEAEALRRRQAAAEAEAAAQRQHRISVGRSLMGDPNYHSVVRLIATIFVSSEFEGLALTNGDQAEVIFYIPQDIKNRMYGLALLPEALLTGDVISRIRERDWSAFSEIIVDFDAAESMSDSSGSDDFDTPVRGRYEPDAQHILATPEIEDLLKSTLKSDLKFYLRLLAEDVNIPGGLKDWLIKEMDTCIDQQLEDIYRNYDTRQLNGARQTLLGTNLSYVSEVSFRSHNSERLANALQDSRWGDVSDSVYVMVQRITDEEIQERWRGIYVSTRDLDPKRAFDSTEPFSEIEEGQIAGLIQGIQREAAIVTTLELIFLKERAEALFNNLMGI